MHVQRGSFDFRVRALEGGLVNAHAVGEMRFEEVVIAEGHCRYCFGQVGLLGGLEVGQGAFVGEGEDEGFVGPGCPVGT